MPTSSALLLSTGLLVAFGLLAFGALIGVLMCSAPSVDQREPSALGELARYRAQWESLRPSTYTFLYSSQCSGPCTAGREVQITVQNDKVVMTSDGERMGRPTVDKLFDMVKDALEQSDSSVRVRYHHTNTWDSRLRPT